MDNTFTELRQLEQTLRHLTMIAEQANEGIVVVDFNGINRFVNTAAAKMHGYVTRGELVGKQMDVFHTEEQMKTDVLPLVEEVKRRGQLVGPIEHVRSDGTAFPTETKMTLLKDGRDKAVGLIVFVTDMTERRQAEGQLEDKKAKLSEAGEQLEQRTAELALANEMLQQQITEHRQAEESFRQQMNEMVAANEQLKQQIAEHKDSEEELLEGIIEAETPTEKNLPFNPQELKALSELAKRLR